MDQTIETNNNNSSCQVILKTGKNKGSKCNNNTSKNTTYCNRHLKLIKPTILSITSMCRDLICYLATFLEPEDLYYLSQINIYIRTILFHPLSTSIWNNATLLLIDEDMISLNEYKMISYKNELSNYQIIGTIFNKGCQKCGKCRIRKVYWEFRIRVCYNCLQDLTISDYWLTNTYKIDLNLLKDIPSIKKQFYNECKYIKFYNLTFYLIQDVEQKLNMSLETIKENLRLETLKRNNLVNIFDKLIYSEFGNKTIYKLCPLYLQTRKDILNGNIPNENIFTTNIFISTLTDEYNLIVEQKRKHNKEYYQKNKIQKHYTDINNCIDVTKLKKVLDEAKYTKYDPENNLKHIKEDLIHRIFLLEYKELLNEGRTAEKSIDTITINNIINRFDLIPKQEYEPDNNMVNYIYQKLQSRLDTLKYLDLLDEFKYAEYSTDENIISNIAQKLMFFKPLNGEYKQRIIIFMKKHRPDINYEYDNINHEFINDNENFKRWDSVQCLICNNNRIFKYTGLVQHSKDIHKGIIKYKKY